MFDWRGFLVLAKTLADESDNESALRSAASRAYYASFHHAKSYIERTDPNVTLPRDGRAHEQLPDRLKEHGRTARERSAARKLEDLKRLRTWADYQATTKDRLSENVQQAVRNASWILTELSVPEAGE